ncbi:ribonuclease H-like domain-containing protein [Tanacetum coccineum]
MTHPHPKGNFVPKAILMKSGIKTLNTARQNFSKAVVSVNTARPINTAYPTPTMNSARTTSNVFNIAHSHVMRPFNKFTTNKNSNFNKKVNTIKENVTSVGPKAVGNPQLELQKKGVIDSGCSRHMTRNKSYLSDYEEIDCKLDFEDVYFVKELKFNLFSVSQMCDKKNSVLFTDTEYVVLSPDFKLLDENHATLDESNLWHRRLGHINFKTMNKLVRRNLVRGLPLKIFENDHTCVACQKGKQHKASCRKPALSFMRPFGCPVTILNTLDHLGNQTNGSAGTKESIDAGQAGKKIEEEKKDDEDLVNEEEPKVNQEKDASVNNTNSINTVNLTVNSAGIKDNVVDENIVYGCKDDSNMPNLEEIVYSEDDEVQQRMNHKDFQNCMFACFLSQAEPKKVIQALQDPSWIEAIQEELLQFKLQQVWTLVDLPYGKRAIGTKWVYRNKKDERGNVIRNKARMVAQGYTQEERIYNTPILINIAAEANLGYYFIVKQS